MCIADACAANPSVSALVCPSAGSEQAPMAESARVVWVEGLIAGFTQMHPAQWQQRLVAGVL